MSRLPVVATAIAFAAFSAACSPSAPKKAAATAPAPPAAAAPAAETAPEPPGSRGRSSRP